MHDLSDFSKPMFKTALRPSIFTLVFLWLFIAFASAQVAVNNVAPGQTTVGQDITIDGTGFTTKPSVSLVNTSTQKKYTLKVKSFTATQIIATVQSIVKGTFDVNVKVKSSSAALPGAIAVPDPNVMNVTPTTAAPNDTVTLTGDFFGSKKVKVLVNGKSVKILTWTNTQITFAMPKLAAGSYPVVVDNKIGQDQAGNITCNVPPAPISGSDRVEGTANGSHFSANGKFLAGVYTSAAHLIILNGGTPGLNGINVSMTMTYDLANGALPTVYNTGQGGVLINYTEVNGGSPNNWTSALGGTYKVTITGKSADSIEGTFECVLPKGQGSGAANNTITNGIFKKKLNVN